MSLDPLGTGAACVDAENPWPGLSAFGEADRDFFHGREDEAAELTRLILRERLTVLFGLSGLGKTSLLGAGVFPRLRQENVLPVFLRLDFSAGAQADLSGQVRRALQRQAAAAGIEAPSGASDGSTAPPGASERSTVPPNDGGDTLWELFHRQGAEFWSPRNRMVTPLLVFDQFEEIFTLGQAEAPAAAAAFLTELADLIEGRPPAALRARLDAAPNAAKEWNFSRHAYKILFSLREDFLPDLESLRGQIRGIVHNRLRLTRMNGLQALDVVLHPGGGLVERPVAEEVVRFCAGGAPAAPLAGLEIEPALLSVVCRELNQKRRERGEAQITSGLLAGSRAQILAGFYERSVADLPVPVRAFVEDRLITASGLRNSVAREDALEMPGVTGEALDRLIERRLLRIEDRGSAQRYELTHDVLTGVIRASRDQRRQQEAQARAEAQRRQAEAAAREAHRKLRRSRRAMAALALLLAAALGGMIWGYLGQRAANQAQHRVQRALAESDVDDARYLVAAGMMGRPLAYLARAVRLDPGYVPARSLLVDLLLYREWTLPRVSCSHQDAVAAARFTPDGRRLVTAASDGKARVWDATDGRPLLTLEHGGRTVTAMALSPDGGRLILGVGGTAGGAQGGDWRLEIWDLATGRRLAALPTARRAILSRRFDPTGRRLVYAAYGGAAAILDLATGRPAEPGFGQAVYAVDWSPDGRRILTGEKDGAVRLWDSESGRPVATFRGEEPAGVVVARFRPDGRRVLAAAGRSVRVWDLATGTPVGRALIHKDAVLVADWSPDGRWILTSSLDDTARVWDAATGEPAFATALHHGYSVDWAEWSPDGTQVLSASRDGTARIWDAATGAPRGQYLHHRDAVNMAAWSPDGRRVVTASDDHLAEIWEVRQEEARPLLLAGEGLADARPTGDAGAPIVARTASGTVSFWDARSGQALRSAGSAAGIPPAPPAREPLLLARSADGRRLATAGRTAGKAWAEVSEVATGKSLCRVSPLGVVTAVYLSPVHDHLLTVSCVSTLAGVDVEPEAGDALRDCGGQLWDIATGKPFGELMRHEAAINAVAWSADGAHLATASDDDTARLWDARTGEPLGEPIGHDDSVQTVEFSPDGYRLATAGNDGLVQIWDAGTGRQLAAPLRHGRVAVHTVHWSADNQRLLTVASDGRVRLWDLPIASAADAPRLAELAEAVGGQQISKLDAMAPVLDQSARLKLLNARYRDAPPGQATASALARWFLEDPEKRTISPLSTVRVGSAAAVPAPR